MRILRIALLAVALTLPGSDVLAAHAQRAPGWIGIGFEVKSGQQGDAAAVVTEVREGSPAAAAGIEVGDRLLTINDVSTAADFEYLADRLALRVEIASRSVSRGTGAASIWACAQRSVRAIFRCGRWTTRFPPIP